MFIYIYVNIKLFGKVIFFLIVSVCGMDIFFIVNSILSDYFLLCLRKL